MSSQALVSEVTDSQLLDAAATPMVISSGNLSIMSTRPRAPANIQRLREKLDQLADELVQKQLDALENPASVSKAELDSLTKDVEQTKKTLDTVMAASNTQSAVARRQSLARVSPVNTLLNSSSEVLSIGQSGIPLKDYQNSSPSEDHAADSSAIGQSGYNTPVFAQEDVLSESNVLSPYRASNYGSASLLPSSHVLVADSKSRQGMVKHFAATAFNVAFPWIYKLDFDLQKFLKDAHRALSTSVSELNESQWIPFLQFKWEEKLSQLSKEKKLTHKQLLHCHNVTNWLGELSRKAFDRHFTWKQFCAEASMFFTYARDESARADDSLAWQSLEFVGDDHPGFFISAYSQAVRRTYGDDFEFRKDLGTVWHILFIKLLSKHAHSIDWRAHLTAEMAAHHISSRSPLPYSEYLQTVTLAIINDVVGKAIRLHTCTDVCRSASKNKSAAKNDETKSEDNQGKAEGKSAGGEKSRGKYSAEEKKIFAEAVKHLATKELCTANANKFPTLSCRLCNKKGHLSPNCPDRVSDAAPKRHNKHH
jgi:hypothetical protein